MPRTRTSRVAPAPVPAVLAIDIGGTKIAAAAIDRRGRVLRHLVLPIDRAQPRRVIHQCVELARALALPHEPHRSFAAAAIAVPGLVRPNGGIWAPNLAWSRMPVANLLGRALAVPVAVESDRNAAVLGEAWAGAARGRRDVVAVIVGTGIGAGILSNGQLVRGAHELSGCLGWLVVADRHFMDRERTGALESVAAGPGIERAARDLQSTGHRPPSNGLVGDEARSSATPHQAPAFAPGASAGKPGTPTTHQAPSTKHQAPTEALTAFTLAARARAGDASAAELFRQAGRHLGLAVGNVISTLDPEVVVIGGGLSGAADLFLPALREAALGTCQPIAARRARIVVSRLGNRANLLGAAYLAWQLPARARADTDEQPAARGRGPATAASLNSRARSRSRSHL